MKKALTSLLILVLIFTLAACGTDGNGGAATDGTDPTTGSSQNTAPSSSADTPAKDTLSVRLSPINTYNPFESYSGDQFIFMNCVYTTLLRIEYDNGEPKCIGNLAESWDQEEDGAVWVFHLNADATFSNGEAITAEDVKYSLEQSSASPYHTAYTGMIDSVEVRDAQTVAVNVGTFENALPWVWNHTYIVNQEAYEADPAAYSKAPVASGAYVVEKLDEATGNITLACRDDYWGDMPAIKQVSLRVISDSDTSLIALESGETDAMVTFGANATQLSKNSSIVLEEEPDNSLGGLFINCQASPWNSVKLRQAAAYAIDYEAMRNFLYDGRVSTTNSIAYNATVDPIPDGIPEYSYDVEKAKSLVAEAGLGDVVDGGSIIGGGAGAGELLQQYLAAVGINITVLDLSGGDYLNAIMSGDYSLCFIPGASGSIRGSQVLNNVYLSNAGSNYARYSNAEVDRLAAAVAVQRDEATYNQMLGEAMAIVAEEIPIVSFGLMQYYVAHAQGLYVPTCVNGEIYIPGCYWQ